MDCNKRFGSDNSYSYSTLNPPNRTDLMGILPELPSNRQRLDFFQANPVEAGNASYKTLTTALLS